MRYSLNSLVGLHGAAWIVIGLAVGGCSRSEVAPPVASQPTSSVTTAGAIGGSSTPTTADAGATGGASSPGPTPHVNPASLESAKTTSASAATAGEAGTAPPPAGSPAANAPFNLFAPPKVDLPVVRQSESREETEPVRLIGFVDVGTMKALLAFDGKIRGLEMGEVHLNVEVVAIDPPRVTLQRGRERWITALFDQPVVNKDGHSKSGIGNGPQVTVGQPNASGGSRTTRPGTGLGSMFGGGGQPGLTLPGMPTGGLPGMTLPGAQGSPQLPGFPADGEDQGVPGPPGLPPLPGLPNLGSPEGPSPR